MRLSIVINNYNYSQFVAQAIDSALAQTHPDVEVVVVDDGSTDASMEVLARYQDRIVLIAKANGGQGSAYNAGFARATGEVILFLDADDWLYPQAAALIVAAWQPGMSKLQFPLDMVDANGKSLGRSVPRHMHDDAALEVLSTFGAYGSPPGSGNAFSRAFLSRELPMDEALWRTAADSVPVSLAPAYGNVASLPQRLGAYRLHRAADQEGLLLNNAPLSLWHEYQRLMMTKQFVGASLLRLGLPYRSPMLFALWEVRIVALCVRYGGKPAVELAVPAAGALMRRSIDSVWHWPAASWPLKMALVLWLLGVWCLPEVVSRRMARMHRRLIGSARARQ